MDFHPSEVVLSFSPSSGHRAPSNFASLVDATVLDFVSSWKIGSNALMHFGDYWDNHELTLASSLLADFNLATKPH